MGLGPGRTFASDQPARYGTALCPLRRCRGGRGGHRARYLAPQKGLAGRRGRLPYSRLRAAGRHGFSARALLAPVSPPRCRLLACYAFIIVSCIEKQPWSLDKPRCDLGDFHRNFCIGVGRHARFRPMYRFWVLDGLVSQDVHNYIQVSVVGWGPI